jgi:hypothetical protein
MPESDMKLENLFDIGEREVPGHCGRTGCGAAFDDRRNSMDGYGNLSYVTVLAPFSTCARASIPWSTSAMSAWVPM